MAEIYGANAALLAKVMDMRMERQNLVMSNLANMNIPSYKARSLDFEKELQAAVGTDTRGMLTRTSGKHVPTPFDVDAFHGTPVKEFKPRTVYGADAVDMDKEMSTMSKNALQYTTLSQLVKSGFDGIQKVIVEGGK